MKKLLYIFVALAAMLTVSCKKDDSAAIEGTWMVHMDGELAANIRLAMILKDGKVDYMVTAWGERYTGTYTYADGVISMHFTKFYATGSTGYPDDITSLDNFHWVEVFPYEDKAISPMTYKITEHYINEQTGEVEDEEATKWLNLERDYEIGFVVKGKTASDPRGGWTWEKQ